MKKLVFTLFTLAILGISIQSCEQSSDFDEIVANHEDAQLSESADDQKDRPGDFVATSADDQKDKPGD
ncbi:MAG: hypothetical protein RLO17_23670 [Cyclobacteriaceae bacterium]|jgi:hypothetical protein|tara:strand:+ start:106 stop:309 length:204 start_codon:yes stop_codon:yes gene_type:complete